jgi:hypothetical protein
MVNLFVSSALSALAGLASRITLHILKEADGINRTSLSSGKQLIALTLTNPDLHSLTVLSKTISIYCTAYCAYLMI